MSAAKHLLRWKGRQSGPFAPEEIRARLKSSDIGLMHEVQVDGQWITVEKFLAHSAPRAASPPAPKQEKKPPAPPPRSEEPKPLPSAPPPLSISLPPMTPLLSAEPTSPFSSGTSLETTMDGPSGETLAYGGFWLRYAAATIDGVILSALVWALAAIALMVSGASRTPLPTWLLVLVAALYLVGSWLYFALMESSEIQATLGKLAVGLIVTDLDGARLTFTHATGRYFGKMISLLTVCAGFFMAAFTDRKQALHDLMAGCHVLLRLPPTRIFQP